MASPSDCLIKPVAADNVVAGAGASLDIDYTVENAARVKLIQMQFNWGTVPTTSENLTVLVRSARGNVYNYPLLILDPANDYGGVFEYLLQPTDPVYLFRGDVVEATYPNTDDQDVRGEIVFEDAS